jgi:hypothetical protein
MGIARHVDLHGLAGLAMLCAMGAAEIEPAPRRPMRYREFCGPPHPKSRQHLRALMRQAAKVAKAA